MDELDEVYWQNRYETSQIQWDIGYISTPLKEYFDQLEGGKELDILIPGGGNSYEAEYLHQLGYKNVFVVDVAEEPLQNLKRRVPDFPEAHLIHADFFELAGVKFDLIVEQTFFCALSPALRSKYATTMLELLKPQGKLVGLLFDAPLNDSHPPFGGSKAEYLNYFDDRFEIRYFDRATNSIPPRANRDLFVHLSPRLPYRLL